jgi:hypothetical protein
MSLALFSGGERADAGKPAGTVPRCRWRTRHLQPPWRVDVRRPATFWDWTAIAYLAVGVAMFVCLVNLLR